MVFGLKERRRGTWSWLLRNDLWWLAVILVFSGVHSARSRSNCNRENRDLQECGRKLIRTPRDYTMNEGSTIQISYLSQSGQVMAYSGGISDKMDRNGRNSATRNGWRWEFWESNIMGGGRFEVVYLFHRACGRVFAKSYSSLFYNILARIMGINLSTLLIGWYLKSFRKIMTIVNM